MSSRHLRPSSPTGRRFETPGRSSTGTVNKAYDVPSNYYATTRDPPSNYTTRETYTSPRSSGDRVVPISKETYVNGRLVDSSGSRSSQDQDRHHHRRSTFDSDARAPLAGSSHLRPSVHHDREVSPGDRSAGAREDRYVSSSSSAPRREQRKIYSIDDGKATRVSGEPELRRRDEKIDEKTKLPPSDRSKAYHLRGSSKSSTVDDYGAYEYTDARGMFRDTEPKWRPRRGSIDTATRERPASMVESYPTAPRTSNRELGPPPSTRGFDKVNPSAGVSRHGSLQGPYQRSPSRNRGYTTGEDENYKVAPRIQTRDDTSRYSDRGMLSPTRAGTFDEYYEPKRRSRFEDREVATRGFGIRPPSIDARSSRESDFDSYPGYTAEPAPLMIEAPPEPQSARRDYPPEPREAVRDAYRDKDADGGRGHRDSPPLRDRDYPRDSDRELGRDRDYPPRDKERYYEEPRKEREYGSREVDREYEDSRRDRDRERERREREYDRYSDEDRRPRDKKLEQDPYEEDKRERDRRTYKNEVDPRDHDYDNHHAVEAAAGTAAAGAAAYGAKELYDKRPPTEDRRDERERDRDRRPPLEPREARPAQPGVREGPTDDRKRQERDRDLSDQEQERTRRYADDDERDRPRQRNYVSKKQEAEAVERRDRELSSSKHSEILDPEEDYRRRVQQQEQQLRRSQGRREEKDEDSDRERRKRDREVIREPEKSREERSSYDGFQENLSDSQALTRYDTRDNEITDSPISEDVSETSEGKRKKRVSIVDPPKEQKQPKSILRKPTNKFPEELNPIREGVAPLKDAKAAGDRTIPPGARWTKINRSLVNPVALEEKGERFEERQDHVIVLRVLTKEDVQKFADRTKEIRGEICELYCIHDCKR